MNPRQREAVITSPPSREAMPPSGASVPAPEGRLDLGWLTVVFLLLSVAAVSPLGVLYRDMDSTLAAVNAVHAVTCAAGVAVAVTRGLRPCLLIASVFPYCWLVVPSAYQVAEQHAAWGDPGVVLQFAPVLEAQLILCLAQMCLLLGYLVGSLRKRPVQVRAWRVGPRGHSRLMVGALLMLGVALAVTPYVVATAGGPSALFQSRTALGQSLATAGVAKGDSVMVALLRIVPGSMATAAAIVALWLVRTRGTSATVRRTAVMCTIAAGGVILLTANPFSSSRYIALACAGSVALAFFRPLSSRAAALWLGLSLAGFLLVYPLADAFRTDTARRAVDPTLASKDFDGFQQTINTVTLVAQDGITYGHHLLSGIFFFIPRAVWAGKAVQSTFPVAQGRGYVFQNLSEPLPAEVYLDLSWLGVAVLFVLLGVAWFALDRAWMTQSRWSNVAAYVALAQVGLWRGPFGSLSPVFGFTSAALVAVVLWSGSRESADPVEGSPRP